MDVESADEIDEFYDVLDTLHGLDASGGAVQTAQIYGTISIENISYADKDALSVRYPNITIDNEHYQSFKYFYSEDGTSLVGQMEYIDGVTQDSVPSYPAKQSTEQYSYTAIGWSESPNSSVADADVSESITQDKNYYVVYRADIRSYTIKFARGPKDGNNVIQTSTVQYGETPSYTGETPTTTHGSTTDFTFIGWSPQIEAVHGDATYYAIFQDNRPVTVKYLIKDMDSYTSDVETIGAYAFQNHTALETVETSATDIGQYAFSGCTNLKVVDLTNQD